MGRTGHHSDNPDGGRKRWAAEGRPLTAEAASYAAVDYAAGVADHTSRVGRDDVRANLARPGRVLLDVRSPEEYRGERVSPPTSEVDHGAERAGRVPGARHLFYRDLLNEDDTFIDADRLKARFAAAGVEPGAGNEVVVYSCLSHRATLAWFAMTHLVGMDRVRV